MIVGGLQKFSLVDYPGKVAAIVFTKGCVFRCAYCHNPDLVLHERGEEIELARVKSYLAERRDFLDGVVVTGGEPTLHKDLPDFIAFLKLLGLSVKLDTNGVTPEMVDKLISARLIDYVAMDIKHVWPRYQDIANVAPGKERILARCRETFDIVQRSEVPHEWRTTMLPGVHTDDDFLEMASYMKPGERYFLQDIRYDVTLDPSLPWIRSDARRVAGKLREAYPELLVEAR